MTRFKTIDDLDVAGKRVLVRADLNVPMKDGAVTDTTRIDRTVPTLTELARLGARADGRNQKPGSDGHDPFAHRSFTRHRHTSIVLLRRHSWIRAEDASTFPSRLNFLASSGRSQPSKAPSKAL